MAVQFCSGEAPTIERMFAKTILENDELSKHRKDASLKGKTIYTCSKESEPSIVEMPDRYLAPSYPGFSIDSYRAGHKLSFLNDAQVKGDDEPKIKEMDNSNYSITSESSSSSVDLTPLKQNFESEYSETPESKI